MKSETSSAAGRRLRPAGDRAMRSGARHDRFVVVLVAACAVALASCGPELIVGERVAAIANGQTTESFPSVGLLVGTDADGEFFCSVTLVGRKTVLTSAHCLIDIETATVVFGDTSYTPRLGAMDEQTDLAVMGLEQAPNVAPTPIATLPPRVGTKVHLVGFGVTHPQKKDSGVKRVAENRVSELQDDHIVYHGAGGSRGNACYGDSGGPTFALVYGQIVQIGVHAFGDQEVCAFGAFDVRLDQNMGWLTAASGGDLETLDVAPGGICAPPPPGTTVQGDFYASEKERLEQECAAGCSATPGAMSWPSCFMLLLLLLHRRRRHESCRLRRRFGHEDEDEYAHAHDYEHVFAGSK